MATMGVRRRAIGLEAANFARSFITVEFRHLAVHENNVVAGRLKLVDGLCAIDSEFDKAAVFLKEAYGEFLIDWVVFGNQCVDGLGGGVRRRRGEQFSRFERRRYPAEASGHGSNEFFRTDRLTDDGCSTGGLEEHAIGAATHVGKYDRVQGGKVSFGLQGAAQIVRVTFGALIENQQVEGLALFAGVAQEVEYQRPMGRELTRQAKPAEHGLQAGTQGFEAGHYQSPAAADPL